MVNAGAYKRPAYAVKPHPVQAVCRVWHGATALLV